VAAPVVRVSLAANAALAFAVAVAAFVAVAESRPEPRSPECRQWAASLDVHAASAVVPVHYAGAAVC